MSFEQLSMHEQGLIGDLVAVIDYSGRLLCSAAPGSHYQRAKAYELRDRLDRLIRRLDRELVPSARAALLSEVLAVEAAGYTMGNALIETGRLTGTA